jgi:hypothetical protein
MSDKDKGETNIKVIYFSGKSAGWRVWNRKFMARANQIGYKKILEGKTAIPSQTVYEAAEAIDPKDQTKNDKKIIKNYKLNEKAYEDLLLSIDDETTLYAYEANPRPVNDRVPHMDRHLIGSSPDGARPVHEWNHRSTSGTPPACLRHAYSHTLKINVYRT